MSQYRSEYLADIVKQYKPLTEQEESDLIKKYLKENDLDGLKQKLVLHNVGIINKAIRKYLFAYTDYDDAVGYGMQALMDAADKFDVTAGYKFSTYAFKAISHRVQRHIKEYYSEIDKRSVSFDGFSYNNSDDDDDQISARSSLENKIDEAFKVDYTKNLGKHDGIKAIIDLMRKARCSERAISALIAMSVYEVPSTKVAEDFGVTRSRVDQLIVKARRRLLDYISKMSIKGIETPKFSDFEKMKVDRGHWEHGRFIPFDFWKAYGKATVSASDKKYKYVMDIVRNAS